MVGEIFWSIVTLGLGAGIGIFVYKNYLNKELAESKQLAERILDEARKEAQAQKKEALLQAKDEIFKQKKELEAEWKAKEKEWKEREREVKRQEQRLEEKEERLEKKLEGIAQKERELIQRETALSKTERKLEEKNLQLKELIQEQTRKLESIAGLTQEEAKNILLAEMEESAKFEAAKKMRQIEMEAEAQAKKKAREILATAIQRYASEYVVDGTVSVVELPNEEMKGRIIGREGRNIRAIEAATGVDLIIDDTPEVVVLSAFNPLRREVARQALQRLIADGRIHPARIEEVVVKVEQELEDRLKELGEEAAFDLGVHGIHPELIRLLGRLYYRTSYSQNVLQHSLEVGFLCGIMAAELGLDEKVAKRAGLLHDIGKAVDHEVEGPHALIGADLAKKYGESPEVVKAIAAHHEDVPPDTVLAVLVQAADSVSGARPGARKELLENYVKRLQELENVATSFEGVEKAYAIQAGRELRVMVNCDQVDDDTAYLLSKDIAKKIENEMTYPGQIKVTVIREKRAVEFAK